jgi:hypothetical protein
MGQTSKVSGVATKVYTEDGYTKVRYHSTDVVVFNQDEIILNSGGWNTVTTKLRMNQASSEFDLGYHVRQFDYQWYVDTEDSCYRFHDGMRFIRAGSNTQPLDPAPRYDGIYEAGLAHMQEEEEEMKEDQVNAKLDALVDGLSKLKVSYKNRRGQEEEMDAQVYQQGYRHGWTDYHEGSEEFIARDELADIYDNFPAALDYYRGYSDGYSDAIKQTAEEEMTTQDYLEGFQNGLRDHAAGYPQIKDNLESKVYQNNPGARDYALGYSDGYDQGKQQARR